MGNVYHFKLNKQINKLQETLFSTKSNLWTEVSSETQSMPMSMVACDWKHVLPPFATK